MTCNFGPVEAGVNRIPWLDDQTTNKYSGYIPHHGVVSFIYSLGPAT